LKVNHRMSLSGTIKEEVVQQQILEAAKSLFHTHGIQKVTMDDVARTIGMGRSSLYYYYKSRDEIFDAVINIDIREMIATITAAVRNVNTIEEQIHAFFISKLSVLRERRSFYNSLDMGMDADAMSQFNKTKMVHHNLIMKLEGGLMNEILTGGIKSGELKPMTKKEKDHLIFVLLSSLHGLKREIVANSNFENIKPIVQILSRTVMNGLKA
jgi:AcrR family transcriptional regulator